MIKILASYTNERTGIKETNLLDVTEILESSSSPEKLYITNDPFYFTDGRVEPRVVYGKNVEAVIISDKILGPVL